MRPLNLEDVNLKYIHYDKPVTNGKGRMIPISYKHRVYGYIPFLVQLHSLFVRGSFENTGKKSMPMKVVTPLVARTEEKTSEIVKFFSNIDNKITSDVKKHAKDWFEGMKKIRYKFVIKSSDNEDDPFGKYGLLQFKVYNNSEFKTKFYNKHKNELDYKEVLEYKNFYMKSIVEIAGLWISGGVFGVFVRPHQFKLVVGYPPVFMLKEYSFKDSDEEEFIKELERRHEELQEKKALAVSSTVEPDYTTGRKPVNLEGPIMDDSTVMESNSVYNKHISRVFGQELLKDESESETSSEESDNDQSDSESESDEYEDGEFVDTPIY
jgi:hypothetical protein